MQQIRNGDISPLYIVYGTEPLLQKALLRLLAQTVLAEGDNVLNYAVFDLEQVPVEHLVQDAETPPFMAEQRLIVGKNAWFLTGTKGKTAVDHHVDALVAYSKAPMESSVVVLTVEHEKLDERKKWVKQLKQNSHVIQLTPLKHGKLRTWVRENVKQKGADITTEAIETLLLRTGESLQLLDQECEKLVTYAGTGGTVTPDMVETLIPRTLEENVFKLVDCVARMQIDDALAVFYDLIKKREEPLKILALMIRQFRLILLVKALSTRGYTQKQMAGTIGVHPYAVKIAMDQARRFSEKALQTLLLEAKQTDLAIKTGQKEKTLAVEWYLLRIPHLAG